MHHIEISHHRNFKDDAPSATTLTGSPHLKAVLWCLKAGQELKDQKLAVEVCLHVLEGKGTLQVEMTYHQIKPGTFFHLEPDTMHAITAKEDMMVVATMTPAPRR